MTVESHVSSPNIVKTGAYLLMIATLATMLASAVGTVISVIISMYLSIPTLVLVFFAPFMIILFLWTSMIWSLPVTFGLLPAVVLLGRNYPRTLYLALPAIGLLAGIGVIYAWDALFTTFPAFHEAAKKIMLPMPLKKDYVLISASGAGFAAGALFSGGMQVIRR